MRHEKRSARPSSTEEAGANDDRLAGTINPETSVAPAEQQAVAVYDGRRLLGHFASVDGFWRAWRADGIPLGVFPTRDEARAAVIKAGRWAS